jgi:SPP1 gp7 family putative phage head morphogenesis protein
VNLLDLNKFQPRRRLRQPRLYWRPPLAVARRYYTLLLRYVDDMYISIRRTLNEQLPTLLLEYRAETVHQDAWTQNLENMLDYMKLKLKDRPTLDVPLMLTDIGQRTSKWNDEEWQRTLRRVLGTTIPLREPWLAGRLELFTRENAALIKSLDDNVTSSVESLVRRGVATGRRHEEIMRELEDGYAVPKRRARLIARDQVSKLNADLAQSRQRDVGIEYYYWETSSDERVRGSRGEIKAGRHDVLDGKLCRWDDPSVYSDDEGRTWRSRTAIGAYVGHPGEDYQCRCWARPKFDQ